MTRCKRCDGIRLIDSKWFGARLCPNCCPTLFRRLKASLKAWWRK